jgi:hypothetical protein
MTASQKPGDAKSIASDGKSILPFRSTTPPAIAAGAEPS